MGHNVAAAEPDWIGLHDMTNVRDIGGMITANGGITRSGVIVRGETPDDLDSRDVAHLIDAVGVRLVVDLRMTRERENRRSPLAEAGVEMVSMPMWEDPVVAAGLRNDYTLDDDAGARAMADFYLRVIDSTGPHACELLELLVTRPGTALLHCTGGKDRTGMVVALLLGAVDVDPDLIVRDYAATDGRLDALFARLSRLHGMTYPPADVPRFANRANPLTMRLVLDRLIDRYGNLRQWWIDQGVSNATLTAWDRRFVA